MLLRKVVTIRHWKDLSTGADSAFAITWVHTQLCLLTHLSFSLPCYQAEPRVLPLKKSTWNLFLPMICVSEPWPLNAFISTLKLWRHLSKTDS